MAGSRRDRLRVQHGVSDCAADAVAGHVQHGVKREEIGGRSGLGGYRKRGVAIEHGVDRPDGPGKTIVSDRRELGTARLRQRGVGGKHNERCGKRRRLGLRQYDAIRTVQ